MSGNGGKGVKQDFRSPVARARGLGSAKSGTGHFWAIRASAIALAVLVPWLIGTLVSLVGADLATVQASLARPWVAILLAAFVLVLFWHTKLGLQVIIEDYVHTRVYELALQLAVSFLCGLGALASLYALARIALLA